MKTDHSERCFSMRVHDPCGYCSSRLHPTSQHVADDVAMQRLRRLSTAYKRQLSQQSLEKLIDKTPTQAGALRSADVRSAAPNRGPPAGEIRRRNAEAGLTDAAKKIATKAPAFSVSQAAHVAAVLRQGATRIAGAHDER